MVLCVWDCFLCYGLLVEIECIGSAEPGEDVWAPGLVTDMSTMRRRQPRSALWGQQKGHGARGSLQRPLWSSIDPWALGHKTSFVQMDACCISRWYGHIQIQQDKCLRTHKGQQVLSPLSIRPGEAARPSDMGAQAHPEPFLSGRCWSLRPLLPVLLPMPQPPPKGVHLSLTPPYPNSPTDYVARGGLSVSF